ncbi:IS3 family transposase, partial [Halobacillus halophilus]|uniref:IS3 family transposase n=1 Tax=Halobacillus halophilus TaxID=1570 RepID=UPI001CD31E1B
AVAEATFKVIKVEFVHNQVYAHQSILDIELFDYVHWFNNFRTHSTLGYLSPVEYKSYHLN